MISIVAYDDRFVTEKFLPKEKFLGGTETLEATSTPGAGFMVSCRAFLLEVCWIMGTSSVNGSTVWVPTSSPVRLASSLTSGDARNRRLRATARSGAAV